MQTNYFGKSARRERELATAVPAPGGGFMTYGDWKGVTGPGARLSGINRQFRPGFGKALSRAYTEWCESDEAPKGAGPCPVRKAKYKELAAELQAKFPSLEEMENSPAKPRRE